MDRIGRGDCARQEGKHVGYLWADLMTPAFWLAVGQIIWINILLSGDNAVVIALACRSLPPRQRFWGILLGAGAAVVLRILFTVVIAQIMAIPFLKLVGGLLLLWIAVKLVVPSEEADEDSVKAGDTLLRAVWLVTVADIVMSLDNVIAIAAAAETAAARVDLAHALPSVLGGRECGDLFEPIGRRHQDAGFGAHPAEIIDAVHGNDARRRRNHILDPAIDLRGIKIIGVGMAKRNILPQHLAAGAPCNADAGNMAIAPGPG